MRLFFDSFCKTLGAGFGFWVVLLPILLVIEWLSGGRFFDAVLSAPGSYAGVALAAFIGASLAR